MFSRVAVVCVGLAVTCGSALAAPPRMDPPPAPWGAEVAPAPRVALKKYELRFKNAPWGDVLDWYSKESGLTLITTVKPKGTFTFEPPAGARYTLGEVTDLLNDAMMPQKLTLIRRHLTFFVLPSDEKIDGLGLIPRVTLEELPERGHNEVVQVVIPVVRMTAEEAADELKKLLTPHGSIIPLTGTNVIPPRYPLSRNDYLLTPRELNETNAILVQDTAGNVLRIKAALDALSATKVQPGYAVAVLKWRLADEVAETVNTLVGKRVQTIALNGPKLLFVVGEPDALALAMKIVAEADRPMYPVQPRFRNTDPALKIIELKARKADEVARRIRGEVGNHILVVVLKEQNHLLVCGASDDVALAAKIAADADQPKSSVVPEPPLGSRFEPRRDPRWGGKPVDPAPRTKTYAPKTKLYTAHFDKVPWAEVLAWYAQETGLKLESKVKLAGALSFKPSKDQKFTLGEITDLLNESLMQQKLILIRGEKTFILHPADEKLDPKLVPAVKLEDLPARGRTEIVEVAIPLTDMDGKEAAEELKKLLSPFGEIVYAQGKWLIVRDTVGNVVRIMKTLEEVALCPGTTTPSTNNPRAILAPMQKK